MVPMVVVMLGADARASSGGLVGGLVGQHSTWLVRCPTDLLASVGAARLRGLPVEDRGGDHAGELRGIVCGQYRSEFDVTRGRRCCGGVGHAWRRGRPCGARSHRVVPGERGAYVDQDRGDESQPGDGTDDPKASVGHAGPPAVAGSAKRASPAALAKAAVSRAMRSKTLASGLRSTRSRCRACGPRHSPRHRRVHCCRGRRRTRCPACDTEPGSGRAKPSPVSTRSRSQSSWSAGRRTTDATCCGCPGSTSRWIEQEFDQAHAASEQEGTGQDDRHKPPHHGVAVLMNPAAHASCVLTVPGAGVSVGDVPDHLDVHHQGRRRHPP